MTRFPERRAALNVGIGFNDEEKLDGLGKGNPQVITFPEISLINSNHKNSGDFYKFFVVWQWFRRGSALGFE